METQGTNWGYALTHKPAAGGGGAGGLDRLKALGGGKVPTPDAAQLEALAKMTDKLPGGLPGGLKLPGLGGGLPPGFNPFKKS